MSGFPILALLEAQIADLFSRDSWSGAGLQNLHV